jgi:cobalt-zinc-cadmium resistance protein CzcA
VIKPSIFGVFIITVVYVPIFALTGVEGKMFHPMAFTVVFALTAPCCSRSPSCLQRSPVRHRQGRGEGNRVMRARRVAYAPALRFGRCGPHAVVAAIGLWSVWRLIARAWVRSSSRTSMKATSRCTPCAFRAPASRRRRDAGSALEARLKHFPRSSGVRQDRHRRGRHRSDAAERRRHLRDAQTAQEWPDPASRKATLSRDQEAVEQIPGNNYEFTQPIQMRFNELISGVRSPMSP